MTKNLTYLLITFCLYFSFSIHNLLTPWMSLIFLVEEFTGLILMMLGFIIFKGHVKKIIQKFNRKIPWTESVIKRLFADFGVIMIYTILVSVLLLFSGSLILKTSGEPAFFQVQELAIKEAIELGYIKHPPHLHGREMIKEFSIYAFTFSILGGSFFTFLMLFIVEESFVYNQAKQKQKLAKEQLEKEQALSKIHALKNQLKPHFMFNTLNVLSGLMHEDLEKADKFIKKLSEIYRYVLFQNEEIVTPLVKEIEFAKAYIYLLEIRFENQIQVSINVEEQKLDWLLPSLSLELLIENAIKHNSLGTHTPMEIEIKIVEDNLVIENSYRPRADSPTSTGIGIKNLKDRLKLLGTKEPNFEIRNGKYVATIPLLKPIL